MTREPVITETPELRNENALKWIRLIAGMHYFGGAFEPEHMRGIANIAADALTGKRDLPDFDESMARSEKKARKWADQLQAMFDREEDDQE